MKSQGKDGAGLWLVKDEHAWGKWVLQVTVYGRRREWVLEPSRQFHGQYIPANCQSGQLYCRATKGAVGLKKSVD